MTITSVLGCGRMLNIVAANKCYKQFIRELASFFITNQKTKIEFNESGLRVKVILFLINFVLNQVIHDFVDVLSFFSFFMSILNDNFL